MKRFGFAGQMTVQGARDVFDFAMPLATFMIGLFAAVWRLFSLPASFFK
jgi:hypothetical protein